METCMFGYKSWCSMQTSALQDALVLWRAFTLTVALHTDSHVSFLSYIAFK